jgi:hypothetical protein
MVLYSICEMYSGRIWYFSVSLYGRVCENVPLFYPARK